MFRIKSVVLLNFGVVHEVGKLFRNGEVTVAHHLLAGVDDGRAHHTRSTAGRDLLIVPQSSDVVSSFEAYRLETFVHAAFDRRQSAGARSDYCNLFHYKLKKMRKYIQKRISVGLFE